MARISKEQREQNFAKYNQAILEIFTTEGYQSLSYDRLAKQTGVRVSTLQGYYPTVRHLFAPLQGQIVPYLVERLDLSSESAFKASWRAALQESPSFKWSVALLLGVASEGKGVEGAVGPVNRLIEHIETELPERGRQLLSEALGAAVLDIIGID